MVSNEQINVIKRNGRGKESLDIDKIHSMVGFACEGITGVSESHVEMNSKSYNSLMVYLQMIFNKY